MQNPVLFWPILLFYSILAEIPPWLSFPGSRLALAWDISAGRVQDTDLEHVLEKCSS